MIASLSGTVAGIGKGHIVIQVGGVGFQVLVPKTLIDRLDGPGAEVQVFTHLHVRENDLTLYGCASEEELALFRLLQTVPGIGPKAALSVLSALPPDRLRQALAEQDAATLARVPGIGAKTAQKLVFDLKDKVDFEGLGVATRPDLLAADADLIAALTGLGYSVVEVQEAIRALPREPLALEERVRLALAYFART